MHSGRGPSGPGPRDPASVHGSVRRPRKSPTPVRPPRSHHSLAQAPAGGASASGHHARLAQASPGVLRNIAHLFLWFSNDVDENYFDIIPSVRKVANKYTEFVFAPFAFSSPHTHPYIRVHLRTRTFPDPFKNEVQTSCPLRTAAQSAHTPCRRGVPCPGHSTAIGTGKPAWAQCRVSVTSSRRSMRISEIVCLSDAGSVGAKE